MEGRGNVFPNSYWKLCLRLIPPSSLDSNNSYFFPLAVSHGCTSLLHWHCRFTAVTHSHEQQITIGPVQSILGGGEQQVWIKGKKDIFNLQIIC